MSSFFAELLPLAERAASLIAAAVYFAAAVTAFILWRLRSRELGFAGLAAFAFAMAFSSAVNSVRGAAPALVIILTILGLAAWIGLTFAKRTGFLTALSLAATAVLTASALLMVGTVGPGGVILLAGTSLAVASTAVAVFYEKQRDALSTIGSAIAVLAALYDSTLLLWNDEPLAILPFAGLLTLTAFGLSVARRVFAQLEEAETLNATLEDRVTAASAGLAASEAARRALEISTAITKERERLMREIHDGIGSSLVTTIAVSERLQKETTSAVVLKRALTDLRIAVDSLEPVQGNAATLLASLRYRVEPDFRRAGIAFVWKVDAVPSIPWLDAVNALHVMRIFQEALGNIAIHSGATEVTVICRAEDRGGEPGVLVDVRDNGKGLAETPETRGHGLDNMEQRARALGARFAIHGETNNGTSVSLWLPLKRVDEW